jgi:hypothetical protein
MRIKLVSSNNMRQAEAEATRVQQMSLKKKKMEQQRRAQQRARSASRDRRDGGLRESRDLSGSRPYTATSMLNTSLLGADGTVHGSSLTYSAALDASNYK